MWYNIINKRSQTAAYFNLKENNVSLKNLGDVTYFRLNNEINRPVNNQIPLHKDKEALDAFFKENVEPNYVKFKSFKERLDYLIEHDYIDTTMTDKYSIEFMEELHNWLYAQNFQFKSFMAAYKFYQQYALKTNDNEYYLENVEDRIWNNALYFADGNEQLAKDLAEELVNQRYQPATPSYLSAGRSRRGELISCFPAGTKITLEGGLSKNIEEIQVGDKVLTHTGSVKPVTELIVTPNNKEKMYVIKPANSPAVTLTANHPVLVYSDEPNENIQSVFNNGLPNKNYKWVRADEIRPRKDYVLIPYEKPETTTNEVWDMMDATKLLDENKTEKQSIHNSTTYEYDETDGYIKHLTNASDRRKSTRPRYTKRTKPLKRFVDVNEKLGRFIGYYLSEGYTARHNGTCTQIVFTFGKRETAFIKDVIEISKELFGIEPKVIINHNDNSCKISISSVLLSTYIHSKFGTGYNKKAFTKDAFLYPNDFMKGLLIGVCRGDGCTYENKMLVTLVNPELVRQLRNISIRLGLYPALRDHLNAAGNMSTTLGYSGTYPSNENFIIDINKNLNRYVEPTYRSHLNFHMMTEIGMLAQVLDVTQTDDANTVYNLEVEDDHSYTAEGIAVHNCFLIDISQDSMNSIGRSINSALQLSRIGGGVGLNLSNLREAGAPIKGIQNAASGVVPVMKLLEDSFSYSNQLGQRQGAGAVYLSVHHPDIMSFLSTKKENADEKIRVKTLSLGLVVTDRFYEAARKNEPLYQFSPYDVEREYGKAFSYIDINAEYDNMVNNPRITKTSVNARVLEEEISKLQQESGYPYIMNVDVVNRANPAGGRVIMSNLCSEILQAQKPSLLNDDQSYELVGEDISCNLGSMNLVNLMASPDFGKSIGTAMRALTYVSDSSSVDTVPTVKNGNAKNHTTALGLMNLHGYLAQNLIEYGSPESLEVTHAVFMMMNYYSLLESNKLAKERGEVFEDFHKSD